MGKNDVTLVYFVKNVCIGAYFDCNVHAKCPCGFHGCPLIPTVQLPLSPKSYNATWNTLWNTFCSELDEHGCFCIKPLS